jgi:hypothetical protein
MNLHTIPRLSPRRPLSLTVQSKVRSRVVVVDLLDISEGGCKIRGRSGFAAMGDRVMMKIASINAPIGTIAWVEGPVAGVAFEGTLHPAVLDHLCRHAGLDCGKLRNQHQL